MADKKEEDYYSILGCERDASMETIRQQYKKLALQVCEFFDEKKYFCNFNFYP